MKHLYMITYITTWKYVLWQKCVYNVLYLYHLQTCADNDTTILFKLLPKLYQQVNIILWLIYVCKWFLLLLQFSADLLGSEEFLNLVVTNVDPQQVWQLVE